MPKYLQIKVDDPCHEKWENMDATATGNFCHSCKKNVIDFTGMTDNQLMEFFKKNTSNICGSFSPNQLERQFEIPAKKIPWLKYFFQISLPALLIGYKANAQRLVKKYSAPIVLTEHKNKQAPALANDILLTGKISGKDGQPIPFASVMIHGTDKGTAADSNGLFTLKLGTNQNVLEISSAGYESKQIAVTADHTDIELNIILSGNINLDAVVFRSNSTRRTQGNTRTIVSSCTIHSKQKKDTLLVNTTNPLLFFPNPAMRNSEVSIRWNEPVTTDQQLVIYNASGVKISQQTIFVKGSLQQSNIALNIVAAGFYTIRVIDMKTKKVQVGKLIVE